LGIISIIYLYNLPGAKTIIRISTLKNKVGKTGPSDPFNKTFIYLYIKKLGNNRCKSKKAIRGDDNQRASIPTMAGLEKLIAGSQEGVSGIKYFFPINVTNFESKSCNIN
jgi:hypothetical protein